jgi:hypothetical protein
METPKLKDFKKLYQILEITKTNQLANERSNTILCMGKFQLINFFTNFPHH